MKSKLREIEKNLKLDQLAVVILVISVVVILFSLFSPLLFTGESFSGISFDKTGQIGDTLGGIMNPFIAIAGVLLTFLAFYIQFKANKTQFELFRHELDLQNLAQRKADIENQFYEMLRLHRENVNEVKIQQIKSYGNKKNRSFVEQEISGRPVFELLRKEFELLYKLVSERFENEAEEEHLFNEAYGLFFHGFKKEMVKKDEFFKRMNKILKEHKKQNYNQLEKSIRKHSQIEWDQELNFEIFSGRTSILAHYFRHLFIMVKFIANQDETIIDYRGKRRFIRLIRAQLSDSEQALLLYNWKSKFGNDWENEENKFFTDYRMIHNLYDYILLPNMKLENFAEFKREFRKEPNREFDPLFEGEDWMRKNKHKLNKRKDDD